MSAAIEDVLQNTQHTIDEVALVIPHQANKRIIDAVGQKLALPQKRVYTNVRDYGNTGSATVPFALWEAKEKGRIHPGDQTLRRRFLIARCAIDLTGEKQTGQIFGFQ